MSVSIYVCARVSLNIHLFSVYMSLSQNVRVVSGPFSSFLFLCIARETHFLKTLKLLLLNYCHPTHSHYKLDPALTQTGGQRLHQPKSV